MSHTTEQPPIGNVPAEEARKILGALIRGAEASSDPTLYWTNVLAMVTAGMAAHTHHAAVLHALDTTRAAQILHNEIISQPNH